MDKYQKSLKERADSGDKSAEDLLIHSYVESLLEPVMPMIAMRVKTIMEEVFDQTRNKYAPTIRTDNSAVIANLQAENERLRNALCEIRDSKFCSYENTSSGNYEGQYGIGVTDGHRFCANIAREALAISKMETTTREVV